MDVDATEIDCEELLHSTYAIHHHDQFSFNLFKLTFKYADFEYYNDELLCLLTYDICTYKRNSPSISR